jgi:hypothetical protein
MKPSILLAHFTARKSSTIVGLVSALLSGKAPLPGQKQSGTLIHAGKVSANICIMSVQDNYYFISYFKNLDDGSGPFRTCSSQ